MGSDAIVAWDWITSLNREWRFIWKAAWTPVKAAYLFCRYENPTSLSLRLPLNPFDFSPRYWVLAVGCFLLYCFVTDHSLEMCLKIYKVDIHHHRPDRGHP